jgi:hypothetical protein
MGMLVRIWSYCADQGVTELGPHAMRHIMGGDRNGPRKLKALIDAGFLESASGGVSPHDVADHNPILRANDKPNGCGNGVQNGCGNVSSGVEQNQQVETPLSRPMSPSPKNQEEKKETQRESAGEPAAPVRKAPSSGLIQNFDELFRAEAFARKMLTPTLTSSQRLSAIERVRELAAQDGDLEKAARSLLKAAFDDAATTGQKVCFALAECQPGKPAVALRGLRGTRVAPAPAAPHSAFDNDPDRAELVWARMQTAEKAEMAVGT